uniref:Uncharacterized protein n=1 Tax=Candidatus Kentrum sp. LPFa TaxID=2126335 RepID=A0A450W5Q2_9GAMM|nr:MAG: hypothetical protein BECKLPF1236B_GA0070989_103326 [Candidatus Kentron sp. LPFa]
MFHRHDKHGEIQEERIYRFHIERNRLFEKQIILERQSILTQVSTKELIEEYAEVYPVLDPNDFQVLGQDAGFEYVEGKIMPNYHMAPTIMHILRKP